MSALCQKPDMATTWRNVRLTPKSGHQTTRVLRHVLSGAPSWMLRGFDGNGTTFAAFGASGLGAATFDGTGAGTPRNGGGIGSSGGVYGLSDIEVN